jgi:hypothetical protein
MAVRWSHSRHSRREADELRKEQWFRDELVTLRSNNEAIWNGIAPLAVRNAESIEMTEFQNAKAAIKGRDADGILLAYLVPLDGPR